jgi:hypothetical protein
MDLFTYLGNTAGKVLRGENLSVEEAVLSIFLTLALAAAAVPLAIEAGVVTYQYGKTKGWWK